MFRQIAAGLYSIARPAKVALKPIHLQIEPTTFCNLRCKSCPIEFVIDKGRHIDYRLFTELIDEVLPQQVLLSGIGEPFLNPEILDLVRYLKKKKATVNVTTNATLLEGRLEDIVASGLDILSVSIDAAAPGTYVAVRGKDCFTTIIDNLRALDETKRRLGSRTPFVRTHFVLQAANIDEAPEFVSLSKKLGAEAVYFQPLILSGGLAARKDALVGGLTFESFRGRLDEIEKRAAREKMTSNIDYIVRKAKESWAEYAGIFKDTSAACILPWFSAYVTVDGRVQPCCSFATLGEPGTLGTVGREGKFMDIWNNPAYRRFRCSIRKGGAPFPVCRECSARSLFDFLNLSSLVPGFLKPFK